MAVVLVSSADRSLIASRRWCAIGGPGVEADPERRLPGIAATLDEAFHRMAPRWLELARALGREPSAFLAHTPSAAANISDFGLMSSWTNVVDELARGDEEVAVVCDDPWLFRHLKARPGVRAVSPPPPLWPKELRLTLRGLVTRLLVSLRMARAVLATRGQAGRVPREATALLVYGHPASRVDGYDAYFGQLRQRWPHVCRMLHVDCSPRRARALAADANTFSLHGFGQVTHALGLWRKKWRPQYDGAEAWLVRRAAALEGGGGQAAMIDWQIHCQMRWIAACRPRLVAWPWENHGWERAFAAHCRDMNVRTLGCQHATIGRHEVNHAIGSLERPDTQLPDLISVAGPAFRDRLQVWGIPADRLRIGGVWRISPSAKLSTSPRGPVFLALPAHPQVAAQMLAAARALLARGYRFVVREHPMTPVGFVSQEGLEVSAGPLAEAGPIRAVVFAGTSVGLEAALGGVPVIRFLPEGLLANEVVPEDYAVPASDAAGLGAALASSSAPPELNPLQYFCPADLALWEEWVGRKT